MNASLSVPAIDKRKRIPRAVIAELARLIKDNFHPQKIILFGSYAYGHPSPESDVDLLVVMETPLSGTQQALEIRQLINPLFGVDILVYKPENLKNRINWGDSFLTEIVQRGEVLYESTNR